MDRLVETNKNARMRNYTKEEERIQIQEALLTAAMSLQQDIRAMLSIV